MGADVYIYIVHLLSNIYKKHCGKEFLYKLVLEFQAIIKLKYREKKEKKKKERKRKPPSDE